MSRRMWSSPGSSHCPRPHFLAPHSTNSINFFSRPHCRSNHALYFVVESAVVDATTNEWTATSLEYDVYEQREQNIGCKAGPIRGPALSGEQRPSAGVHACDLAGNAALDHSQR